MLSFDFHWFIVHQFLYAAKNQWMQDVSYANNKVEYQVGENEKKKEVLSFNLGVFAMLQYHTDKRILSKHIGQF